MDSLNRPLTTLVDCDEIVPGQLWLGSAICPLRFPERLAMNHITHILNLTTPYPQDILVQLPPSITVHVVPIVDTADVPLDTLDNVLKESRGIIDQALQAPNSRVLVHCDMGASRSPCIVAHYLMHQKKWTLREALDYLAQRRLQTEPNFGFVARLRCAEATLFATEDSESTSLGTDELYTAWLTNKRAASKLIREQRKQEVRHLLPANQYVYQREVSLRKLNTQEAFNMLQLFGPKVVDVQSASEFAKSHILEAVSIPYTEGNKEGNKEGKEKRKEESEKGSKENSEKESKEERKEERKEESKEEGIMPEYCKDVMFAQSVIVCGVSEKHALRAAKALIVCFAGMKKAKVTTVAVLMIPVDSFLQQYPFFGSAAVVGNCERSCGQEVVESKNFKEEEPDKKALKLPPRLRARMQQREKKMSTCRKPADVSAAKEKRLRYPSEVIPGALYQGHKTHAANATMLRNLGVTHVVNASFKVPCHFELEGGNVQDLQLKYLQLKLRDVPCEDATPLLNEGPGFIQDAIDGGGCVFVHCQEGKSRSTTVVLAYLMRRAKILQAFSNASSLSLAGAFNLLLGHRPDIQPNRGYIEQLGELELKLRPGLPSTVEQVPTKYIRG